MAQDGIRENVEIFKSKLIAENNRTGEKYYLSCQIAYEEESYLTMTYKLTISNFVYLDENEEKPFGNLDYFLTISVMDEMTLSELGEEIVHNGFVPGKEEYDKLIADGKPMYMYRKRNLKFA